MSEKVSFYNDGLPEGSKIKKLSIEIDQIGISDADNCERFFFKIYDECYKFVFENMIPIFSPQIKLTLIYQTELYKKIEREKEKKSIYREPAKGESTGFHVGNKFKGEIFVNVENLLHLFSQSNYQTFILNFVMTFFHEILHCCYLNLRTEQEIFNLECELVEKYLGIELSEERKKLKSRDYYKEE